MFRKFAYDFAITRFQNNRHSVIGIYLASCHAQERHASESPRACRLTRRDRVFVVQSTMGLRDVLYFTHICKSRVIVDCD